jgi:hypothetical protein
MCRILFVLGLFFSLKNFAQKADTRLTTVSQLMDSLNALCDKTGRVISHPDTRKGEINYFSSKNENFLHTVKLDYEGAECHKIHIYSYGGSSLKVFCVNDKINLINWHKPFEQEISMVRLNDTTLVWSHRRDNYHEPVKSIEFVPAKTK